MACRVGQARNRQRRPTTPERFCLSWRNRESSHRIHPMISLSDLFIYAAHVAFWLLFAAGHAYARRCLPAGSPSPAATDAPPLRAPYSRLLVGLPMVAFA